MFGVRFEKIFKPKPAWFKREWTNLNVIDFSLILIDTNMIGYILFRRSVRLTMSDPPEVRSTDDFKALREGLTVSKLAVST